jgi:hypothetical protein
MPSDATDDVDGGAIFRPTARRPVPGRRGRLPRLSTARSSTRTSKSHRSAVCRPGAPSASSVPPPFRARRLAVRPWSILVDHVLETPARSLLPVRHCVDRKTHPVTRRQCRRWLATSNAVRPCAVIIRRPSGRSAAVVGEGGASSPAPSAAAAEVRDAAYSVSADVPSHRGVEGQPDDNTEYFVYGRPGRHRTSSMTSIASNSAGGAYCLSDSKNRHQLCSSPSPSSDESDELFNDVDVRRQLILHPILHRNLIFWILTVAKSPRMVGPKSRCLPSSRPPQQQSC